MQSQKLTNRILDPSPSSATIVVFAMILAAVAMQLELVFSKSINWDEYFHFSEIHRDIQGRSEQWLQVPYVWLYSWVPSLPGDNIAHIQLIRLFTLPFELLVIGAIILCATQLANRPAGLLCGLFYVTGGYVFLHAFALRGDPIAAGLLMVALWIGICRPLRVVEIAVAAVLIALAFIATIKSILYAPAFFGVILYRLRQPLHRWVLSCVAAAFLALGALLLWMAPALPANGTIGLLHDIGMLGRDSIDRMFSAGLFPQEEWLKKQMAMSPLLTAALAFTALSVVQNSQAPMQRLLRIALLLPLCTVAFYRNAFPYHYVFILPPAIVAIAPTVDAFKRRLGATVVGLGLLVTALVLSMLEDRTVISRQRTINAGVHEIFPEPVTYIDDCGMVGDFPRAVNHFASGWGLAKYRRLGLPAYSLAMGVEPVPLLLANRGGAGTTCFDLVLRGAFLWKDYVAVTENYIPHWGNVFVAGKRIAAGGGEQSIEVAVPGRYTVEGGQVTIDRKDYAAGSVVDLARGTHFVTGNSLAEVTLRWGDHLSRPAYPWPSGTIFTAF